MLAPDAYRSACKRNRCTTPNSRSPIPASSGFPARGPEPSRVVRSLRSAGSHARGSTRGVPLPAAGQLKRRLVRDSGLPRCLVEVLSLLLLKLPAANECFENTFLDFCRGVVTV